MSKNQERQIASNELHQYRLHAVDFSADSAVAFLDQKFPEVSPAPVAPERHLDPTVAPDNVISLAERMVHAGLSEVDSTRALVAEALKEPTPEIQEFNDPIAA